jgi:hypothetical protein
MMRHTIPLGRILGIPVGLDYFWLLVFVLLTWFNDRSKVKASRLSDANVIQDFTIGRITLTYT